MALGHDGQLTLSILGTPVSVPIRCCLYPLHKGPCKKDRPGKPSKLLRIGRQPGQPRASEKVGDKASEPVKDTGEKAKDKAGAKKPRKPADPVKLRARQVKKILSEPTFHGVELEHVQRLLTMIGEVPGWRHDEQDLSLTYRGQGGLRGGIRLIPSGYETTVTAPDGTVKKKTFKTITDAVHQVRGQVGPPARIGPA